MKSCNFCYNGGKNFFERGLVLESLGENFFELCWFDEKFNGEIFLGAGFLMRKICIYIIRLALD